MSHMLDDGTIGGTIAKAVASFIGYAYMILFAAGAAMLVIGMLIKLGGALS